MHNGGGCDIAPPTTMNILSWNCQGLGNPRAVTVLSHLVGVKAPKIVFLMETKQSVEEMRSIKEDLQYHAIFTVPSLGRSGGLAMIWKEDVDLHVQTSSQNHIDAIVFSSTGPPWRITGFYGQPEENRRHETWSLLRHLHSRYSMPWVCIGDYNEILSSDEKQGRLPKAQALMQAFRSALLQCNLIDLGYVGNDFTWNNGRHGDAYVQQRLDRACAIVEWRELFPHCRVTHLQVSYSDHDPIFFTTNAPNNSVRRKRIPHRFEEKWAAHPECEWIIQQAWNQPTPYGSPMFKLFEKIKNCRTSLIVWARFAFGNNRAKIEEMHRELEELTRRNIGDQVERIKLVRGEINRLLYQEEVSWRQSRAIWLPAGDKNTKFFHQRASQ